MDVVKNLSRWGMSSIVLLLWLTLAWGAAPEPSITSAKINKKELKGVGKVTIIKDDLTSCREILIVGVADGGGPRVEKVEVSLDGGQIWEEAIGRETWQYRFVPVPNYTYFLTMRVTNAEGTISDHRKFGLTRLTYLPLPLAELIQQRADELARAYMSQDMERYMGLISRGYQNFPRGWHRLRRSIHNDFISLDNIILRFTVNQVFELGSLIMADIHWKLMYAGLPEPKEGFVEIHFDPAEQMKIIVQKKDLYFGAAPIGSNGTIQVAAGILGFPGNYFVFVVRDLDKAGARRVSVMVRITGSFPFTGNVVLTETPLRSGRFVGSRRGADTAGDRATATYTDEITSDWRRNVRRSGTYVVP